MPNLARPSVRLPVPKPRTKILVVRQPMKSVRHRDEPDRAILRVIIGVVTALGIAGIVWLMGHLGYRLGFAPLMRVPELTSNTGDGLVTGAMMIISMPSDVFRAGLASPMALMLAFVLIALPAAGLSAAKPLVRGGPRPSQLIQTFSILGAAMAGLNAAGMVWWTLSPARDQLVRELPFLPQEAASWLSDLQTAAGLDVLALICAGLWTVLAMRLAIPLWLRALTASACVFAFVIVLAAASMTSAAVTHITAGRAVAVSTEDDTPALILGHTSDKVVRLRVSDDPHLGQAVLVELSADLSSQSIVGRQSIIEMLSAAAKPDNETAR